MLRLLINMGIDVYGAIKTIMKYSQHTEWSDPHSFLEQLVELPCEPRELADALENFIIHHAAARSLDLEIPQYAETDRNLRTVGRLLKTVFERDHRPLTEHREPSAYLYGTCHDFALLAVSRLRSHGFDARLRVGVVDYLEIGYWEDHWLCEYFTGGKWHLFDAQLGNRARSSFGIDFDIGHVPRHRFRSGCELWLDIRSGKIDPAKCGVSFAGIHGEWFAASNVLRDVATLAVIEPLPWDSWGPAREINRNKTVPIERHADFDGLANQFVAPPASLDAARSLMAQFPWAEPGDTVLSFVDGALEECSIV